MLFGRDTTAVFPMLVELFLERGTIDDLVRRGIKRLEIAWFDIRNARISLNSKIHLPDLDFSAFCRLLYDLHILRCWSSGHHIRVIPISEIVRFEKSFYRSCSDEMITLAVSSQCSQTNLKHGIECQENDLEVFG